MTVSYRAEGHVRIITIERPESRNAIDRATNRDLYRAWQEFKEDDDAWVAILTGAGDSAFSAGADLKEISAKGQDKSDLPRGIITRDFTCEKPIIAAMNGSAFGGGLEMAMACDIRVAVESAKLALSEVRWALMPGGGGTQRLPRAIPVGIAMEMLFTAEPISAGRAYDLGLVNRVVPVGDALDVSIEIALRISENGPAAVRAVKEAVTRGLEVSLAEGLRIEQGLVRHIYTTEDAKEGPLAFKEKRPPDYKGL